MLQCLAQRAIKPTEEGYNSSLVCFERKCSLLATVGPLGTQSATIKTEISLQSLDGILLYYFVLFIYAPQRMNPPGFSSAVIMRLTFLVVSSYGWLAMQFVSDINVFFQDEL